MCQKEKHFKLYNKLYLNNFMKVKFSLRGLNKNKENIMGMQTIRVIKKTKDNVTYRLLYLPKETKVDDITTSWESSELMKKYSK